MPRELQYLTVQDHLWINFQVTRKKNRWNFAKLEEGTYMQYAYGKSTELMAQAAQYATGFVKKQPFTTGNEATGFVGLLCFLFVNGYHLKLRDDEAAEWFLSLQSGSVDVSDELRRRARRDEHEHELSVAEAGESVLKSYPRALEALTAPVAAATP